jgi:uncharacterized protein involved in outer membrane biogenesis
MAVASPFLISLDDYIPRIETEVSARLQEPVSVKSIRFRAFPLPHVMVEGITIGTTGDIRIGRVRVIPDLFSLLQSTRVIRSIEIDSLALRQKAIDKISMWARKEAAKQPQQSPPFRVLSIRIDSALVNFDKAIFGPFDARVNLDARGDPADASVTTQDGKLKVLVKPDKANYLIDARAKSWTLPVGPALKFDELVIKGVATPTDANFGEVSARLYGGTVKGNATVAWRKGLQLGGVFDVSRVELQHLATILSPGTHVSGKLSAKQVLSASAASADKLMSALRLEAPFDVQKGVLQGVDIQKAATNLIKQGTTGGETRFEQLSGHLLMERGINAQVKALGTSANVPLNVAGTVDSPFLYPTGGTIAGAAAGTVLLGPGLGTSVGAKVGGWAEGLFGRKEEKIPKK